MKTLKTKLLRAGLAVASVAALTAVSCSDDGESDPAGDGDGDPTPGDGDGDLGGAPGDGDGDGDDDRGGAPGDGDGDEVKGYIVSGWVDAPEGWFGFLTVADDFSSDSSVDLEDVFLLEGDHTITGFGGVVYVGLNTEPVIQKYVVKNGAISPDGQVNFAALGVTNTFGANSNVIQIIDENKGWFLDHANGRVVVFNPSEMTTEGETIDYSSIYDGLDMDGEEPEDDWPDIGEVGRVGDYIVIPTFWYEGTDGSLPLETRVALLSTVDDSVSIIKDDRCAGSTVMSNDSAGNLYLGPHAAAALYQGAGDAVHSEPCIIRIKNGETAFDQDYLVNLFDHSSDKVVAGLYQGPGNTAYVFEFQGDPAEGAKARFEPNWQLATIELGASDPKYTKVEGQPLSGGVAYSFPLTVDGTTKHYLSISAGEGAVDSLFYQLGEDGPKPALSVPSYPYVAVDYY